GRVAGGAMRAARRMPSPASAPPRHRTGGYSTDQGAGSAGARWCRVAAGTAAAAQFLGRFAGGFLRGARSACGSRQWQSPPPPGAAAPGEASVRVIRYGVGLRGRSLSRATSVLGWLRVGRYLRRAGGPPPLGALREDP